MASSLVVGFKKIMSFLESDGMLIYQLALEPSEKCPLHGGAIYSPRCRCGKFVKVERNNND